MRYDLKIKALVNEEELNGRIVDVKDKDLAIIILRFFPENTKLEILIDQMKYCGKIINVREPNPGRGYLYGVKLFAGEDYAALNLFWKNNKLARVRKRFIDDV